MSASSVLELREGGTERGVKNGFRRVGIRRRVRLEPFCLQPRTKCRDTRGRIRVAPLERLSGGHRGPTSRRHDPAEVRELAAQHLVVVIGGTHAADRTGEVLVPQRPGQRAVDFLFLRIDVPALPNGGRIDLTREVVLGECGIGGREKQIGPRQLRRRGLLGVPQRVEIQRQRIQRVGVDLDRVGRRVDERIHQRVRPLLDQAIAIEPEWRRLITLVQALHVRPLVVRGVRGLCR